MNKDQLSQELKQKLKLGIKPSDLKKLRLKPSPNISQDKNNIPTYPDPGILTPPLTPPLKPRQENIPITPIASIEVGERDQSPTPQPSQSSVKQLRQAVKFWSTTAQNHLLNLSKTSAELFKAEERIKELEWLLSQRPKPATISQAAEQALIEANQKIRELEEKNKNPLIQPAKPYQPFSCPACRTPKKGTPTWIKVAVTDSEYNLVRGQAYPFCSSCSPKIKEFNHYDLLTPELWDKYPYSEAKEILELEFGIKEEKT